MQLGLFDTLRKPPVTVPIEKDGPVVQGEPDEVLRLEQPRMAWDRATIELHRHTNGLWMWSASWNADGSGVGYRVGPKWGRFAESRDDALFYAVKEIEDRLSGKPGPAAKLILSWARSL
ncbi:hypothetical protein [Pararhizobium haloflavum]|uniref:hypothetical protein n=1 Tax=Pararhizobium haloflavum TaxID=2037914 RepID=UPI000C190EAB|nr:hypothetical protein [Pararhizobium haloflavum]